MPKCKECKYCLGYDLVSNSYMCGALEWTEWIDVASAEDKNLGCDFYVEDSNVNTTKRS